MADGNGKGRAQAFEDQFKRSSAQYRDNGYTHDDGRGLHPRCMAKTLAEPPPDLKWLVPDLIPSRTVTLLTGDGGVGKSLLAMQLQTCCASGRPFLGYPVEQCASFGLYCEDENDILHHRQRRLSEALHIADADLDRYFYMDRAGDDSVMYGPMPEDPRSHDFTDFWYRIHAVLKLTKPKLIVLDTAADIFGANENFRPDVRLFVRELRKMSYEYDAAVVLCAHPSLAGMASGKGYSGSTAWHNSVRSRLYLTKPEDAINEDDRLLAGKKNNYGPAQGDIKIRYTNGAFMLVEDDHGTVAGISRSVREKALIELVRSHEIQGRHLSKSTQSGARYLPLVAGRSIPGMKAGLAKKIMIDLMIDGAISEAVVDRESKRVGLVVSPEVTHLSP